MIITGLWSQQPGKFFCISTKSSTGKWKDHLFARKELKRVLRFIEDNLDKDLYFCPHGFSKPERKKEYACLPSMLWADMDECDPRQLKKLKPTIAIESSPGRFVGLWLCDDEVSEELNRRLTYEIGADRGGWDLTQVLRIPRTTNYKYNNLPKVRLLWDNGPTYKVDDLDDMLPEVKAKKEMNGHSLHAPDVWRKYERNIPAWARRQVLNGKPRASDDRSTMLWRLEHAMLDAGMSEDEAFVVIKASPWNKFAGRRNEDEQLRRELDKAVGERLDADIQVDPREFKFLQTSLADVEPREIDWLWYPYLARGEITLLDGDPGSKKSWIAQVISKAICDGDRLPGCKKRLKKGRVAYFDLENEASTVTVKRMTWAGMKNFENFVQDSQRFSLNDPEVTDHLFEAVDQMRPDLIVFDTLNHYLGGDVDIHRSNEVVEALDTFVLLARRYNCSTLCLRHLNKGSSNQKAMHRGLGSVSFVGTARIQLIVGRDPEDRDTGVLTMAKTNLSREADSLTFYVEPAPTLKEPDRARFEWGDFVDLTSDDVVGTSKRASSERDGASEFLREALADGPVELRKLKVMAEKRSISQRTLFRAADAIGVKRETAGFGADRQATWTLS